MAVIKDVRLSPKSIPIKTSIIIVSIIIATVLIPILLRHRYLKEVTF